MVGQESEDEARCIVLMNTDGVSGCHRGSAR